LAYDEETGEQAYKEVVRLFRNETNEWYHIHANGEEIICTGGHPFYVAGLDKFIPACELKVGEELLLSSGVCAIIEAIQIEQLTKPETTYNFEVADFHTYYVTDSKVLVHNKCWEWGKGHHSTAEEALKEHYELHGSEVGATSIDDYFQMAVDYADDVLDSGKFMKNVPGFTKNVQRFTLGDNLYIDIVKKTKTIISFGVIW